MKEYKCETCYKEFKQKNDYTRHLNRKIPCKNNNIIKDTSIIDEELELKKILHTNHENQIIIEDDDEQEKIEKMEKNGKNIIKREENEILIKEEKYQCFQCNKLYKKKEDLDKHLKLECKPNMKYNNIYKFNTKTFGKNIFKNSDNAGEIYIIQTDFDINDVYKIGITTNLYNRIGNYRTCCGYEPRLHYYFPCKELKKADNIIKKDLKDFNIKREIFKGKLEDIKKAILKSIRKINDDIDYVYGPEINNTDICQCSFCSKFFLTKQDLQIHFKNCTLKNKVDLDKLDNKEILIDYKCKYCNKRFKHQSNYYRHINHRCKEKPQFALQMQVNERYKDLLIIEMEKKDMQIKFHQKELKDKENQIKELEIEKKDIQIGFHQKELKDKENQIKELKEYIKNTKPSNTTYNISVKNYVQKNYANAPALKKLDDYGFIKYDDKLLDTIGYQYRNKILDKYLGDFLIGFYKKEDPAEQAIWNSDVSRLTYVIKELLVNNKFSSS